MRTTLVCGLVAVLAAAGALAQQTTTVPLPRAHAHNDYLHARPLLDALDHGFCSVEADINLVDGALLVAHSPKAAKPDRTLQALYLEPLRERVRANGGEVYPDGPPFSLLIDIKTDPGPTYEALHAVLTQYADILTVCRDGETTPGAVTVLVDNADKFIAAQAERYACIDGRFGHLDANPPAALVPWVSGNWRSSFVWKGEGPMPEDEKARLREYVARAHEQGRKIRFWGLPRKESLWREVYDAGVDLVNADDLPGLRDFLLRQEPKP